MKTIDKEEEKGRKERKKGKKKKGTVESLKNESNVTKDDKIDYNILVFSSTY